MPASGPWLTTAKLRALFSAGLTYEEIAEANERATGWKPTRSGVAKKFERLGFPPRNASHVDLIPWTVRPEHNSSRYRHMLQAESRKRAGMDLTASDRDLVSMLYDLLFGRGSLLVVGYRPDLGFYLTDRTDEDEDIVRVPPRRRPLAGERETDPPVDVVCSVGVALGSQEGGDGAAAVAER